MSDFVFCCKQNDWWAFYFGVVYNLYMDYKRRCEVETDWIILEFLSKEGKNSKFIPAGVLRIEEIKEDLRRHFLERVDFPETFCWPNPRELWIRPERRS